MSDDTSKYPEHAKLALISDKSQAIGEFLEWLTYEKGIWLCCFDADDEFFPIMQRQTDLLAEFFKIDQKKIDEEKDQMLAAIREANGA